MQQITKTIFVLSILLFTPSFAFAGTGQIFSPSGLPQSSNQSYTVPTPGVGDVTQSFPTPPLPLGGSLQGFPSSPFPVSSTQQGSTRTTTTTTSGAQQSVLPVETSSVESFFQYSPVVETPDNTSQKKSSSTQPQSSPHNILGKVLWHTLDNLGVPMFIGKDNDLDPSLSQTSAMPPESTSPETTVPATPQKIPESELEGIEVSPKNDTRLSP